jgi:hypothetical protein
MPSKIDIKKGEKFGKLTILKEIEKYISPKGHPQRIFLCECECGNIKQIALGHLRKGITQSCGCFHKELLKKHGYSYDSIYKIWSDMKRRCLNSNCKAYKNYGGRGIKVCDRWLESFNNFLEDMGERPEGLSIDRINNDGNYEPSNCKWATNKEQINNRRTSKKKEV